MTEPEETTRPDARAAINERIAEIRSAGFSPSRRGYDREEVQRYLAALADWLEGLGLGDADRGEVRRELAWVGERTSEILTKAEETGREIQDNAVAEAERLRAEAEDETRHARLEASREAEEIVASAERRAEELLEESARRRQDLQTLIGDLLDRRDEIIADGNRLADELAELFAGAVEDVADDEVDDDEVEDGEVEDGEVEDDEFETEESPSAR